MIRFATMLIAATALAGCMQDAAGDETRQQRADRELAEALEGRVAGEPVDCVPSSFLSSGPSIIDADTLLYSRNRRVVYVNELRSSCPPLARGGYPTLIVEPLQGSQHCRLDRFRVLERGANIPSGYCVLGSFTPYTRAEN